MWMQQSMESASFSNGANLHQRNRFGGSGSASYSGGGMGANNANGDWKSKILEGGQWLGGKVIEYGGKIARGGSHDSIPDHMAHVPRNDGRANWMADIRNSSSSYSNGGSYAGGGSGGTYQNDFATERPKAYSDSTYSSSRSAFSNTNVNSTPAPPPYRDSVKDSHRSKNSVTTSKKRSKKKSKKHSKRRGGHSSSDSEDSDSASDSDVSSPAEDSASDASSDAENNRRRAKTKRKSSKKRRDSFSSEEDTLEAKPKPVKTVKPEKAPADYSFSFDPAKLPAPPADNDDSKKSKSKVTKKAGSKSRGRRQSMESTASESSDKENTKRTKKTKGGKTKVALKNKSAAKSNQDSVDLLGVDFMDAPVATPNTAPMASQAFSAPSQQLNVFDQPLDPLQALAGLNFNTTYTPPAPAVDTASTLSATSSTNSMAGPSADSQVLKKLLPDNNIIDLDSLASDKKKKSKEGAAAERKTLNELQSETKHQHQQTTHAMSMYANPQMGTGMAHPMQMGAMQNPMQMQMQMQHMQMNQMQMNNMMQFQAQQGYANPAYAAQQGYGAQSQQNTMNNFAFGPQ